MIACALLFITVSTTQDISFRCVVYFPFFLPQTVDTSWLLCHDFVVSNRAFELPTMYSYVKNTPSTYGWY